MKKFKLMLAMTVVAMAAASCGTKKEEPKMLVLYYSQTGNTKMVAEEIANRLGADIEEIVCVNPYDPDFQATIQRCMQEREQGVTPEIQPLKSDLSKYDVIFLGYPVWFGTYATPVITFLNNVNLTDKKVVPFCTFGSGGLESSMDDLIAAQPDADVLCGYGVRAARLEAMPAEVDQFLKSMGFLEGEYTEPEEFPEQHEVNEEEAAIFDAAVGDYPMINAQAKSVAVRALPNGTEYLFTAEDKPREDKPDMPPAGKMQVYVTVADGQAPVFTKVVR
ncbi:MAG: flavodoxin domain-containing protein [Bacteroidales bacterium]|nr:flavodoxin domain-containing protein [Bacteroidales bacterium]